MNSNAHFNVVFNTPLWKLLAKLLGPDMANDRANPLLTRNKLMPMKPKKINNVGCWQMIFLLANRKFGKEQLGLFPFVSLHGWPKLQTLLGEIHFRWALNHLWRLE